MKPLKYWKAGFSMRSKLLEKKSVEMFIVVYNYCPFKGFDYFLQLAPTHAFLLNNYISQMKQSMKSKFLLDIYN